MIQYHFRRKCSLKSKATFQRPNINTVYKGEYSLRWFGPIVWDSMIPEKTKSLSNFEELLMPGFQITALAGCVSITYQIWVLLHLKKKIEKNK